MPLRVGRLWLAAALLAGLAWGALTPVARATTIAVTTTADDVTINGNCTLREAIRAANLDVAVDACPAGSGADTIELAADTYTLTLAGTGEDETLTGDLDVSDDLTLVGAGMLDTIIDAGGLDRVVHVVDGADVGIRRLTLQGGDATGQPEGGGGVKVFQGDLTLNHTRVRENVGDGAVRMHDWAGRLTARNSRIVNNDGRGLLIGRQTETLIVDSTISGNDTGGGGGGMHNSGALRLVNSTISGNNASAGGGGIFSLGSVSLYNVTITGNTSDEGGGVFAYSGAITATNTIVAGNSAVSAGPDCYDEFTSAGYNLLGDTAGCMLLGDETGNAYDEDADLGPLQGNGGSTFTHALLAGSPAIDAGDPDGCRDGAGALLGTDQRGWARNGRCDMGSFEHASPGTPTPTPTPTATRTTTPTATRTPTATATPPATSVPGDYRLFLPLAQQ